MNNLLAKWYIGLGLGLIGVAGVLVGTASYGPGMSPDSISYVECAKNLLAGQGFEANGGLYTRWPPLFPLILAAIGTLGVKVQDASRYFNAACFGLIVFCAHRLFAKDIKTPILVFTGAVTVLLLDSLLKCSMMILTEALYTLLTVLFVIAIHAYTEKPDYKRLFTAALVAGMACLTRYFGISVIMAGCLIIVFSSFRISWTDKIKRCLFFGITASLPLIIWMARNYVQAGSLAGSRGTNPHTILQIFEIITQSVTGFIMPHALPLAIRIAVCVAAVFLFVLLSKRFSPPQKEEWSLPKTMVATAGACIGFLIYSYLTTCLDPTADRYLAPVQFTIVFLAIYFLDRVWEWAPLFFQKKNIIGPAITVLCVFWMGGQSFHVISMSKQAVKNPSKSLAWIQKTSLQHPEPAILITQGNVLCDLRRYSEAAQSYQQAAQLSKSPGPAWILAGQAALKGGDIVLARHAFTQAANDQSVETKAKELLSALSQKDNAGGRETTPGNDSP